MTSNTLIVLLFIPIAAQAACPKGTEPFKDTCVVELHPEAAISVQPSNEKPPTDKMPSWQREGITLIDCKNLEADDERMDRQKADANAEGKRNAGL